MIDPELTPEALREVDVGRRFERVILGSHLVNTPDEPTRGALLALAARHARADGEVLVEHHPLDWAQTAEATPSTPGADVGMERVERDPPFVSAVTVYDIGGRTLRVPFRARVLSEVELAEELRAAGFASVERLAPTWLLARRGAG